MSFLHRTRKQISRLLDLRRSIQLVWQSSRGWTIANIVLVACQAVLPLLSLYLTKLIIDTVTIGSQRDIRQVVILIICAGAIAIVTDICRSLTSLVSEAQFEEVTDYVQNILHAKSIEVDLEYYENAKYYDAVHQAQEVGHYRSVRIIEQMFQVGQSIISLGAIALLLLSLHWAITTILFIAVLPLFVIQLKYSHLLYDKWMEWTEKERYAYYFSSLLKGAAHAKEVRLFNLGELFQSRFHQLRQQIRKERLTLNRNRSLTETFTQGSATIAMFAAFGFIASQTLSGAITIGSMIMYYEAFQRGQALLQQTLSNLASLYESSLYMSKLYEFIDLKRTVVEPRHPRKMPQALQVGIEFHHVRFDYPHSTRPVLDDISFTINAGETIALVGQNGAGKTTLIKLLCRLYDPTYGKITIDGIDLREFETTALRQIISVVFQDYARYNLTVRENIGFGNTELLSQDDRIKSASQAAGVQEAIDRLPYGYDTTLGNEFAEGEELSIGEWQKIAIARSFLRQSQIIVLDEPTSALDPQAEAEVLAHFRQLTENCTAILISHRLSTVKLADRIIVLENGKISESGTHDELIELQGTYAHLFETQAQSYR